MTEQNKLPLIGLCGIRASGKDSVAKILVQDYVDYRRQALGDQVKQEVVDLIIGIAGMPYRSPYTREELLTFFEEHKEDTIDLPTGWVRQLLQSYAQMRRNLFGSDYWLQFIDFEEGVVVSDVRYPDEVDMIHAHGGSVWQITRPGVETDGHISEPTNLDVDLLIENEGSLDDLKKVIYATMGVYYGLLPRKVSGDEER